MTMIHKIALPRRAVLRGIGAALGLPFLQSMAPALTAASKPTKRLGFVYLPNGVILKDFVPATEGSGFELTPILHPLAPFRDQLTVVTGLANAQADPADGNASGPHSTASGSFLSGVRAKRTERGDIEAGTTIDQHAAQVIGRETPLLSLELATEPNFTVGSCESGYSCTYVNTFSWRNPTSPLPMEINPRRVFERLFSEQGHGQVHRSRSILDSVSADLARLQKSVGPSDRRTVDGYLEAVRDVERRLQQTEQRAETSAVPLDKPMGVPAIFDDHVKLMCDLMVLAYQTDMTRVVTFQLARELSGRSYPEIGVPEGHHDVSHHGNNPESVAKKAKIDVYHMQLFSYLVQKMRSIQDGDGTLLDHSILVAGGGLGNGNSHVPHNIPIVCVGGGAGTLTGGRHLKAELDTPFMNLGLSLLDKFGVELAGVGDSTGRLTGI